MPYYINQYKRSIQLFKDKVEQAIYDKVEVLDITAWVTSEPVPFSERTIGQKLLLGINDSWGELWDCAWFNFKGIVPKKATGKKVVLLIDISGEICIFDETGSPVQGLTNISSEFDLSLGKPGKRVVQLYTEAEGGEYIDIWADAGCNDLFGYYRDSGSVKEAHIAICNEEMRQLYYDIEVLQELMQQLPEDSARQRKLLFSLVEASNLMNKFDEEEALQARKILAKELNKKGGDESLRLSAIGHAHIDLAWLWPIRETIRKGARTFSTALRNMETYPDYVFGASQPQLYQWMKESYPQLYKKIKQRVAEGRWEVQGAMWVEADTNVAGGEALVRQVLYGKKFFKEEFDKDIRVLWLPDVFGYSAALPQILKKSGVDYFMTIKLSWNSFNKFPHHTFLWKGLDGSKVLAHMPPEGTYNSSAAPRAILGAEKEFLDKGVSEECLMLFGIGDGGGGPGEEHLERLKREKNLNGIIPVKQEQSIEFFERIEKDIDKYKTWSGELYLEKHQGTYTTQAKNKYYNRKLELALRELEYASVMALVNQGKRYPQEEIESLWKEVLLYQFHDILPGSSIKRVYDESIERYEYIYKRTIELTKSANQGAFSAVVESDRSNIALITNSLSWDRNEWVKVKECWIKAKVSSMGYTVINKYDSEKAVLVDEINIETNTIENDMMKILFNKDGSIASVYDKKYSREVLDICYSGNVLTIYDDKDGNAWDFSPLNSERPMEYFILQSSSRRIDGPKCINKQVYVYNSSTIVQEIVLTAGSKRIDFNTTVDWKETNKMLRTSFPVNIFSNEVTCDIQYGNIKRPTHENTSWDMAKYEICAQKWIDLSQGDYGVALLNDCKYGHKVKGNIMDINLLRSTTNPGIEADQGVHQFTYSLYPHEGDYKTGEVIQAAYELNVPLNIMYLKSDCNITALDSSFIKIDAKNIIIESVKKTEYGEDIIVRLYETYGCGVKAKLNFGFNVAKLQVVNLMEEAIESNSFDKNTNELAFNPYEIHTLRISL